MLAACGGGGAKQDAHEASGSFPVQVTASFPTSQRLSQHTHMVVTVRNAGSKTIPDVAVTVTDPPWGTTVQPFGERIAEVDVANHSRAVWIVDQPPGPCGYSCQGGTFGSGATASTNTWALGALKPGATATFDWGVTAVTAGHFTVAYRVAAGLNGHAKAELQGGGAPGGQFNVAISGAPATAYVNNNGQIVAPNQTGPPSGAASQGAGKGALSGRPASGPPTAYSNSGASGGSGNSGG